MLRGAASWSWQVNVGPELSCQSVVRMLRRGALLGLALLGLVQGGPGGPVDQCVQQCKQVYSINQANFEQVRKILRITYGQMVT